MAANIPLPDSPPASSLPSPTQSNSGLRLIQPHPIQPSNPTHVDPAPSLPELTLSVIIQALLPILSGKHTLLSLYEALDRFSQDPTCSLTDQTKGLFKSLSERRDQLDRLKICDTTHQHKIDQPPPHEDNTGNLQDGHSVEAIKTELQALQIKLKQEEEKRAKSISLLRAVRQKLVQTEKDRSQSENDLNQIKSTTSAQVEELKSNNKALEDELSKLKIFNDQQLSKLRHSSEREILSVRSQHEREAASQKSQSELDTITAKAAHERELSNRNQKISHLENRLFDLSADRDKLFDQLQNKQAELETAQAQLDEIKGSLGELKHQLNESHNRIHGLVEELDLFQNLRLSQDKNEGGRQELIQELEQQNLAKTKALQSQISQLEKERVDIEQELTDSLRERLQQIETLRAESRLKSEEHAESLQSMAKRAEEISRSDAEMNYLKSQLESAEQARDSQTMMVSSLKQKLQELQYQSNNQVSQLESVKCELIESIQRESDLRSENQRIRENEIQKVDEVKGLFLRGGAAKMMDQNQRKQGVGYFATFSRPSQTSPSQSSTTSPIKTKTYNNSRRSSECTDDEQSKGGQQATCHAHHEKDRDQKLDSNLPPSSSHRPLIHHSFSSPAEKLTPHSAECHNSHGQNRDSLDSFQENEAELNFEYLRNTLLQFLDHKEMRPHLVRVLGVILHFTPQEVRV